MTEANGMSEAEFKEGTIIIEAGEPCEAAYIIKDGSVEVSNARMGGQVRIAKLGKGDLIGEMALISGREHYSTVTALTDVTCAKVSKEEFEQEISGSTPFLQAVLKVLVRKLQVTTNEAFGP